VPQAYHRVVDRAIQVWGAAGVSGDLPLAAMYQGARTLRLADGPDEVHKILIAKNVLRRYREGSSWDFGNQRASTALRPVARRRRPPGRLGPALRCRAGDPAPWVRSRPARTQRSPAS
jgi:hypothetical protein